MAKSTGLLLVVLVVVGGVGGTGFLTGLGNASVLAALTALFCLIAATGGPLRADMRLLAGFAPALVIGAAAPRLLGAVSHWGAVALLVVVVFVAGFLPALGARYVSVGLGLGMASLFGYGFHLTSSASAPQIIGAPLLAVVAVMLLRLLMGARDPSKPTRDSLATALTAPSPAVTEQAARLWLADRPVRWTTRVLGGILRRQAVTMVLADRRRALTEEQSTRVGEVLDAADREAAELAELIRSRSADANAAPARPKLADQLPGATTQLVGNLWEALDTIRTAVTERDNSRVDVPPQLRRMVAWAELQGALSWRSAQLRHAVRCALGMTVALIVAGLRPGDPLTVSFLMATFAILQPDWRDSLSKAAQRLAGALAGALVLVLVLWLLPQAALLPIGLVAVLGGFSLMRTQPVVFNACMVLMSVGVNVAGKHLEPGRVLVEYLSLMLLAAAIALVFGFATVPGVPKPSLTERFDEAVGTTRELLSGLAELLAGQDVDRRRLGWRIRQAGRARLNLVTPETGSTPPSERQREAVEQADEGLHGLFSVATALLLRSKENASLAPLVAEVARALEPGAEPMRMTELPPTGLDDEQRLLADTLVADVVRLHQVDLSSPPRLRFRRAEQ